MVSEEQSRNSSMPQDTFSGTAGAASVRATDTFLGATGFGGNACAGAASAAGLDGTHSCGGARPASFSRDWAIEASGAEKLGNWTRAIRRAAIQKM